MTHVQDEAALVALLRREAEPLPVLDDPDFARAFDRYGDARVVLIGEASHGTSEFYRARAAISRRLIEHHGFSIVAVEADWPDAAQVDAWVRGRTAQDWRQEAFRRFPLWMWRNRETAAFTGAAGPPRPRRQGAGLGAQLAPGQCRRHRDGLERADQAGRDVSRRLRAQCGADRPVHRSRRGGRRRQLGRADAGQGGGAVPGGQLGAAVPARRPARGALRLARGGTRRTAPGAATVAAGAGHRRHLPAAHRAGQPLLPRRAGRTVRRLAVVRGNPRGHPVARSWRAGRAEYLAVRGMTQAREAIRWPQARAVACRRSSSRRVS